MDYFIRNFLSVQAILSITFIAEAAILFYVVAKYTPGDRNGR